MALRLPQGFLPELAPPSLGSCNEALQVWMCVGVYLCCLMWRTALWGTTVQKPAKFEGAVKRYGSAQGS